MNTQIHELVFVYNADSSLFSLAGDFVTKITAPSKYQCNLCMITYGPFAMKKEWKEFLAALPYKKTFLHKDEFQREYTNFKDIPLPAIFLVSEEGKMQHFVSKEEIKKQKDLAGLKRAITDKLRAS